MSVPRIGFSLAAALLAAIVFAAAMALMASPATAQGGVCPENPDPVDADDPNVIVDTPVDGDEVTSPMAVEGQARVFEANVRLTLFDAQGDELVDTFTTAAEAGPALAPYATTLEFDVPGTGPGCLRVFEESAQDGSPVNVVQVEVTLVADEVEPTPAATPGPPETGTGILDQASTFFPLLVVLVLAMLLLASTTFAAVSGYRRP